MLDDLVSAPGMHGIGDEREPRQPVDAEGLRQILLLPLRVGPDQLKVVLARPVHVDSHQRAGGASGVGTAESGGVYGFGQVGAGNDDVVQLMGTLWHLLGRGRTW